MNDKDILPGEGLDEALMPVEHGAGAPKSVLKPLTTIIWGGSVNVKSFVTR